MWAADVKPPTLAKAIAQFPNAGVVRPTRDHHVFYVDGRVEGWWTWSTDFYELMPVMLLELPGGRKLLLERVAVDEELTSIVYGRTTGRYAFIAIKDVIVFLGFHSAYHHENLTSRLRRIHKPGLTFRFKWPRPEEVEAGLHVDAKGE